MAEAESAHRRDLECKLLIAQIEDAKMYRRVERTGQHYALIISIIIIIGGFIMIYIGHALSGSLLSGSTLIALVALFIYGRERKMSEMKEKTALNQQEQSEVAVPH